MAFSRDDTPDGSWDPTPVQTTIEFRDMQAQYTFPVGVTTLWWYAPNEGNSLGDEIFFDNSTVTFEDETPRGADSPGEQGQQIFKFPRNL